MNSYIKDRFSKSNFGNSNEDEMNGSIKIHSGSPLPKGNMMSGESNNQNNTTDEKHYTTSSLTISDISQNDSKDKDKDNMKKNFIISPNSRA